MDYSQQNQPYMDGYGQDTSVDDGAHKRCNCKKAKCLKLYCVCFSAGVYCSGCACQDCMNTIKHQEQVWFERQRILQRSPRAFAPKVEAKMTGDVAHKKGCRCRKSRCLKKYCECYDAGVPCSAMCRCEDCQNQPENGGGPPPVQPHLMTSMTAARLIPDLSEALKALANGSGGLPAMPPGLAPPVSAVMQAGPGLAALQASLTRPNSMSVLTRQNSRMNSRPSSRPGSVPASPTHHQSMQRFDVRDQIQTDTSASQGGAAGDASEGESLRAPSQGLPFPGTAAIHGGGGRGTSNPPPDPMALPGVASQDPYMEQSQGLPGDDAFKRSNSLAGELPPGAIAQLMLGVPVSTTVSLNLPGSLATSPMAGAGNMTVNWPAHLSQPDTGNAATNTLLPIAPLHTGSVPPLTSTGANNRNANNNNINNIQQQEVVSGPMSMPMSISISQQNVPTNTMTGGGINGNAAPSSLLGHGVGPISRQIPTPSHMGAMTTGLSGSALSVPVAQSVNLKPVSARLNASSSSSQQAAAAAAAASAANAAASAAAAAAAGEGAARANSTQQAEPAQMTMQGSVFDSGNAAVRSREPSPFSMAQPAHTMAQQIILPPVNTVTNALDIPPHTATVAQLTRPEYILYNPEAARHLAVRLGLDEHHQLAAHKAAQILQAILQQAATLDPSSVGVTNLGVTRASTPGLSDHKLDELLAAEPPSRCGPNSGNHVVGGLNDHEVGSRPASRFGNRRTASPQPPTTMAAEASNNGQQGTVTGNAVMAAPSASIAQHNHPSTSAVSKPAAAAPQQSVGNTHHLERVGSAAMMDGGRGMGLDGAAPAPSGGCGGPILRPPPTMAAPGTVTKMAPGVVTLSGGRAMRLGSGSFRFTGSGVSQFQAVGSEGKPCDSGGPSAGVVVCGSNTKAARATTIAVEDIGKRLPLHSLGPTTSQGSQQPAASQHLHNASASGLGGAVTAATDAMDRGVAVATTTTVATRLRTVSRRDPSEGGNQENAGPTASAVTTASGRVVKRPRLDLDDTQAMDASSRGGSQPSSPLRAASSSRPVRRATAAARRLLTCKEQESSQVQQPMYEHDMNLDAIDSINEMEAMQALFEMGNMSAGPSVSQQGPALAVT